MNYRLVGGQPHSPTRSDTYESWLIPEGAWIQGNVWAIHHHDREFPNPDHFFPERYLKGNEFNRPFPNERGYMTFGWGRRVCSGQALAEQGTWITIARLLWGFDIRKPIDPITGEVLDLNIFAFTNGLNMRPQPFNCEITPRGEAIKDTIVQEGKDALRDLGVLDGESMYRMSTFYQNQKKISREEPVLGENGEVRIKRVE